MGRGVWLVGQASTPPGGVRASPQRPAVSRRTGLIARTRRGAPTGTLAPPTRHARALSTRDHIADSPLPAESTIMDGHRRGWTVQVRSTTTSKRRVTDASPYAARNRRLYSNGRTMRALRPAASGCWVLMTTAASSGTMTEGTTRSAAVPPLIQSDPGFTLARPAGMADHVMSSLPKSKVSLADHVASGTVISTRYRFSGSPPSSMCAAVSSTAIAIVGAVYRAGCPTSFQRPGLFAAPAPLRSSAP